MIFCFAASIISKKVAEQPKALVVLDVKFSIGAEIQDKDHTRELAQKMV